MTNLNLDKILYDDQIIKTKVLNYPDWINNCISKIDGDIIHIEFKPEYLKSLLTIGDTMNINFQLDDFEYDLVGFVENISLTIPPHAIIRIEDIISHKNIRKFIRCNINLLCKILPSNDEFKIQGITTDISEGGISMVSYADFNVKDVIAVEIITDQNDILRFKGNIKRLESKINNHMQYGIEIVEIDDENKSILNKIISISQNNI